MSAAHLVLLAVLLALLIAAPALLGGYGLSVLILVLYFAYVGQAWNIMMGFAGQLSLGHALYAGLGGYAAAGLYFHSIAEPNRLLAADRRGDAGGALRRRCAGGCGRACRAAGCRRGGRRAGRRSTRSNSSLVILWK